MPLALSQSGFGMHIAAARQAGVSLCETAIAIAFMQFTSRLNQLLRFFGEALHGQIDRGRAMHLFSTNDIRK